MKHSFLSIMVFAALLMLIGCQSNQIHQDESIAKLIAYKNSYVGDNSAIFHIVKGSIAGRYVKEISLETKKQPYGITVNYGSKHNTDDKAENFEEYWNTEQTKKAFLNNASTLFILVDNVEVIKFHLETNKQELFTITRNELEEFYGKDLRLYADNEDLWRKEIIEATINDKEKLNAFYKKYPGTVER